MLTRSLAIFAALIVAVWITAEGCAPDSVETTELVQVHGTVLLDGKPVKQAKVVFVPNGANMSRRSALSYGITDDDGNFQLQQRDQTPGALAARYRVYISQRDPHAEQNEKPGTTSLDGDELPNTEAIPEFFNRQTDLQYDVVNGRGILQPEFKLSTIDPLLRGD